MAPPYKRSRQSTHCQDYPEGQSDGTKRGASLYRGPAPKARVEFATQRAVTPPIGSFRRPKTRPNKLYNAAMNFEQAVRRNARDSPPGAQGPRHENQQTEHQA